MQDFLIPAIIVGVIIFVLGPFLVFLIPIALVGGFIMLIIGGPDYIVTKASEIWNNKYEKYKEEHNTRNN